MVRQAHQKTPWKRWILGILVFSLPILASPELDSEFLLAVKEGALKKVEGFLSQGAKIDAKDGNGRTALMVASGEEVVEFLIKNGANLNAQDQEGNSVLFYRLQPLLKVKVPDMDDLAEAKRLIESGAQVEYAARKGEEQHPVSLLNIAIRNKNLILTKFLVENGANPNHDPGGPEEYPLFLAVGGASSPPDLAITEFLLNNGAKPVFTSRLKEIQTVEGVRQIGARNAFHYATETLGSDPKIFDLLSKAGTNINQRDAQGTTPLMEAISRKNVGAAEKLLGLGADVALTDIQGKTALDLAKEVQLESVARLIGEKLSPKVP
ncbi:ankyrin repeat domain-containing protein [Leptospira fluminis]|uniref:Ankyrin repeat domain-containing protein n=1 Tax=Leptospira fluminis TaxID=2484979 RepID=A0A4R9GQZ1_9LEPT|nr:ankyrin repeat domain-containing protein [Leptospira fluminis]TGK18775.1 ankyrin repeat domain-containing protein [Leptospira fluminis]